jgi:hypothetical protein
MVKCSVFFAVRTKLLHITGTFFGFKGLILLNVRDFLRNKDTHILETNMAFAEVLYYTANIRYNEKTASVNAKVPKCPVPNTVYNVITAPLCT